MQFLYRDLTGNLLTEDFQRIVFLAQAFDFTVRPHPTLPDFVHRRVVLPESALNLDVGFAERMAVVRVGWSMPIWPVWSVFAWTADPRIAGVHVAWLLCCAVRQRLIEMGHLPPNAPRAG